MPRLEMRKWRVFLQTGHANTLNRVAEEATCPIPSHPKRARPRHYR